MPITIPISLWNLINYLWLFVNRSFSHVVTAAIFVYKTMNRRELNSFHMLKLFFYSKQFAKLLTTWLKTIYNQIHSHQQRLPVI